MDDLLKEPNMNASSGDKIVGRLEEFTRALKNRNTDTYTCRKVVLNLKPRSYRPEDVKRIRKLLCVSQALFARFLGVATRTVRSWEQGESAPSDMACRFMDEIRHDPEHWKGRLASALTKKAKC